MRHLLAPHPTGPSRLPLTSSICASSTPALCANTEEHSDNLPGSNSFAVAGELAAGAALIANDTHLELRVPNIWFRTRLIYPNSRRPGLTMIIIGASLPGTPAIAVGSNRQVAWSFTNSYGDFTDWVRVMLDPGGYFRYRSATGWKLRHRSSRNPACTRRTG